MSAGKLAIFTFLFRLDQEFIDKLLIKEYDMHNGRIRRVNGCLHNVKYQTLILIPADRLQPMYSLPKYSKEAKTWQRFN